MRSDSTQIHVDRASSGTTAATWGQRAIWQCLEAMGDNGAGLNLSSVVTVPDGCDVGGAVRAVAGLVHGYDALRTVFSVSDGRLWQTAEGLGRLTVETHDVPAEKAEATARSLVGELAGHAFRRDEWPIRIALVTAEEVPQYVVLVCSHIALDRLGLDRAAVDLGELMAGRTVVYTGRQPRDQAVFEQSPRGQAVSDRALRYWSRCLTRAPVTVFDYPDRNSGPPNLRRLVMRSEAVTVGLRTSAARLRVSTTAVLLSAAATALGHFTGHPRLALQTICANRGSAGQRFLAGTLAWDGIITLDVDGPSFGDIVRRGFYAGLSTYGNGCYDPDALSRLRRHHELLRGAALDLSAHFNDIRKDTAAAPDAEPADPGRLRRLAHGTSVTEVPCPDQGDARFYLTARDSGRRTVLSLVCDTSFLTPDDMRALLYAIENLVTAAATGDPDGEPLLALGSVSPVQRDGAWTRCGGGWIDLDATRHLWQEVTGDKDSQVFPDTSGAWQYGLVGYLVSRPGRSLTALHAAFVEALDSRADVRAPAWYVACERAPGRPGRQAAWQGISVVVQGSGRPEPDGAPAPGGRR